MLSMHTDRSSIAKCQAWGIYSIMTHSNVYLNFRFWCAMHMYLCARMSTILKIGCLMPIIFKLNEDWRSREQKTNPIKHSNNLRCVHIQNKSSLNQSFMYVCSMACVRVFDSVCVRVKEEKTEHSFVSLYRPKSEWKISLSWQTMFEKGHKQCVCEWSTQSSHATHASDWSSCWQADCFVEFVYKQIDDSANNRIV